VRGLSLGAAALDFGPSVKFETAGDPLPLSARAGAAWTFEDRPAAAENSTYSGMSLTLTADAVRVRNEAFTAAAGGECAVVFLQQTTVSLRLGNQFNSASDGGLSFGVGVAEGRYRGDYALTSRGALGNVQTFSFAARF
jgi:hypothetical protein